jgi:hypothetical protein
MTGLPMDFGPVAKKLNIAVMHGRRSSLLMAQS